MELIRKWVLKNAVEHDGKAFPGAIIPKLIGEDKSLKDKIKDLMPLIKDEVEVVNEMSLEKQIDELKKLAPELLEKKEQQILPDLPHTENVVMVYPPEPSKYQHIGHAKACAINHYYARKYNGKFYIRMEDTNPEKVKEEYYNIALDDFKWLGIEWDAVHYMSDHFDEFIKEIEKLIQKGEAYVCSCDGETTSKNRTDKKECSCRNKKVEENMEQYKKMLSRGYKEEEVVVRLKVDMTHKNAAMRDPAIARVSLVPHAKTKDKYCVYPLYDFATAYFDKVEKVTHRVRSKEFEMKKELQDYIHKLLGIKEVYVFEMGRFNLEGKIASGRQIRDMVERGEVNSWDDPRLTNLVSYKRRGFQPKAIYNFVLLSGLSKAESLVSEDVLASENRKIIDATSRRFFFVTNPVELKLEGYSENYLAKVPLHPEFHLGTKDYQLDKEEIVLIDTTDYKDGETIRLKDLMNVAIKGKTASFSGNEIKKEMRKVHWVLDNNKIKTSIVMPDATTLSGYAEDCIKKMKEGDVIQFERFGFVRIDKIGEEVLCYFTHK